MLNLLDVLYGYGAPLIDRRSQVIIRTETAQEYIKKKVEEAMTKKSCAYPRPVLVGSQSYEMVDGAGELEAADVENERRQARAVQHLRGIVQRTYREWPTCPVHGEVQPAVSIQHDVGREVMAMYLLCASTAGTVLAKAAMDSSKIVYDGSNRCQPVCAHAELQLAPRHPPSLLENLTCEACLTRLDPARDLAGQGSARVNGELLRLPRAGERWQHRQKHAGDNDAAVFIWGGDRQPAICAAGPNEAELRCLLDGCLVRADVPAPAKLKPRVGGKLRSRYGTYEITARTIDGWRCRDVVSGAEIWFVGDDDRVPDLEVIA